MIERESGYEKWLDIHKKTSNIEHEIRLLYAKRDELNASLWIEIPYQDLLPYMLADGIKIIQVKNSNEAYASKEKAWINDAGNLVIGGYEQNDRFPSNRPLFIPKYKTMD